MTHRPPARSAASALATALAGPDGTRWPLVAGYVMLGALISMVAVWRSPETYRRDLRETGASQP